MSIPTRTNRHAILNQKLRLETHQGTFWSRFAGFASKVKASGKWDLSGNPIEIFTSFKEEGRNHLLVPQIRALRGMPVMGRKTLKGNGEDAVFMFHKVFVHLVRDAVNLPDLVDQQEEKILAQKSSYLQVLKNWWAAWENHDVTRAFLEGFSYNITADASAKGGLGYDKRYHKNTLLWDTSANDFVIPTYSTTTATHKSNIISGIEGMAADDTFTTRTLEALPALISILRIPPWIFGGHEVYPMIINSSQAKTLRQDASWLAAQRSAGGTKLDNPIFNGCIGNWGNIYVFVNDLVARKAYANSTGSILDYFNYSGGVDRTADGQYAYAQATGTKQNTATAILLGANAMSKGIASKLQFTTDTDDHGMVGELGTKQYYGYCRNDFYDDEINIDSAATIAEPQSLTITTRI